MIQKFCENVLKISPHEIPRTFYAWILRFLYRFMAIIIWTPILASFINGAGIERLPFLSIIQGLLIFVGMLSFTFIIHFGNVRIQMLISSIGAIFLMCISLIFEKNFQILYLPINILAFCIFVTQINIFISNIIEEYFTPWEAERLLPIIDSADTFGGILAGVTIAMLASTGLNGYFVVLWVITIVTILMIVFFLNPSKEMEIHGTNRFFIKEKPLKLIYNNILHIKDSPFLKSLLIFLVLQWTIAQLIEFQYTKVVDELVLLGHNTINHENKLMEGLGYLNIFFYSFALLIQLVFANKIIKRVGTFGGFLIHSIMIFFSSISLLLGFSYFSVVLSRNNFEASSIFNRSSYEASYYAFLHNSKLYLREFYEGFLYPVGTILANVFLIVIQFSHINDTFVAINVVLFGLSALMIIVSIKMGFNYTRITLESLSKAKDDKTKYHAIEILAQKGHINGIEVLFNELLNKKHSDHIKGKILNELARTGKMEVLPHILNHIRGSDVYLRNSAIEALNRLNHVRLDSFKHNHEYKLHLLSELKQLLSSQLNSNEKANILKILSHIDREETASQIINILNNGTIPLMRESLKLINFTNVSVPLKCVEQYIHSTDPYLKAYAIAFLWKNKNHRIYLRREIENMIKSKRILDRIVLLEVSNLISSCDLILNFARKMSDSKLLKEKIPALIFLSNQYGNEYLKSLAITIFNLRPESLKKISVMLEFLNKNKSEQMNHYLFLNAFRLRFDNINEKYVHFGLANYLEDNVLFKLKKIYTAINSRRHADLIFSTLLKRKNLKMQNINI